jgi:hypothetical protein
MDFVECLHENSKSAQKRQKVKQFIKYLGLRISVPIQNAWMTLVKKIIAPFLSVGKCEGRRVSDI